jgi:hypothetical protein
VIIAWPCVFKADSAASKLLLFGACEAGAGGSVGASGGGGGNDASSGAGVVVRGSEPDNVGENSVGGGGSGGGSGDGDGVVNPFVRPFVRLLANTTDTPSLVHPYVRRIRISPAIAAKQGLGNSRRRRIHYALDTELAENACLGL